MNSKRKRSTYAVIVGNVGTVYSGTSQRVAARAHAEYAAQLMNNEGRATDFVVTTENGQPFHETITPNACEHCDARPCVC